MRHVHRVLRHAAVVAADMHDDAVEVDDRPDRIEPPLPPGGHFGIEVGGDLGDQRRRHIDAVEFLDHVLDVARGHALGVQGEDLFIEAGEPALMLGDQLRLEGAVAVAGRVEGEFAQFAADGLLRVAVAAVCRGGRARGGAVSVRQGGEALRPRWTSISVSSMRSRADFIRVRSSPLRSSRVWAWVAMSPASCSALSLRVASMRESGL